MQTFRMKALGSTAEVEVAFAARFRWTDGTIEFMSNPDEQYQLFGISEEDRDRIKDAIEEHKRQQSA